MNGRVLVTGANGFLATQTIRHLINSKYKVRGTVRSVKDPEKLRCIHDIGAGGSLKLTEASLESETSWRKAMEGCKYVLHMASPLPQENMKHENEFIKPVVEGTLNILRACSATKSVKRVVLTSSSVAVTGTVGHQKESSYNESDWTNPEKCIIPYNKGKTLAEKAAWDFVKNLPHGNKFELAVVNPGLLIGPGLSGLTGTSGQITRAFMNREMPMVPRMCVPIIDVRDAAAAHVAAMIAPGAAGNRHLLAATSLWFEEIGQILANEFKRQGYNPPTSNVPYSILWLMGLWNKNIRMILPEIGKNIEVDNTRMKKILNINAISAEQSIIDMAYSMIEDGQIKKTDKYKPRPAPKQKCTSKSKQLALIKPKPSLKKQQIAA